MVEEARHPTDRALHETGETDQPETSGYQIEEIQIDEKTLTPTCLRRVAELRGPEAVPQVASAGGPAAQSIEAETTLIPADQDLLCGDSPQDEMSVQCPLPGGALDLRTVVDRSVRQ